MVLAETIMKLAYGEITAQIQEINERHTNEHYLPGVFLDPAGSRLFT